MKLIVNADDFGLCDGVNNGIIDSYKSGIVTSTTMLANMPGFEHGSKLLKSYPDLGVGVHLALTIGSPITKCDTLVGENNAFYKLSQIEEHINKFDLNELKLEFKAQINKVISTGAKVTHLDGHHHIHAHDNVIGVVKELADEYGLFIRNVKNDSLDGKYYVTNCDVNFYGDKLSKDYFFNLKNMYEIVEIMCHPAILDGVIEKISSYNTKRTEELEILKSANLKDELLEAGIELVSFAYFS